MDKRSKAKIILEQLADDVLTMDYNREEEYIKAIIKALREIETLEKLEDTSN